MNNIFLIHGEDDFLAYEKLDFFKSGFIKKYGDLNISAYGEEGFDMKKIVNDALSAPFLSDKKMIILDSIFSSAKKDDKRFIIDFLEKVPETTIFFIFERKNLLEKKTKTKDNEELIKKINPKNLFETKKPSPYELPKIVLSKVKKEGYQMDAKAVNTLVALVGSNTRQVEQELKKLMAYKAKEKVISTEDVLKLVKAQIEKGVFDLTDALAKKDIKEAQKIIRHLLESGETTVAILGMINFHFRNLLLIKLAGEEKISESEVITDTKMHPFVYKKTSQQTRGFTLDKLKQIYKKICETDVAIKTGEKEGELALDLLIVKICM